MSRANHDVQLLKSQPQLQPKRREAREQPLEDSIPLTSCQMWTYAAPTLATTPVMMIISIFVINHYERVGADLAFLAFFVAFTRSLDFLTDPLMSGLTDSSKADGGRRLPFLRKGSPAYALFLLGLFAPPTSTNPFWDSWTVTVWFALLYMLYFLSNTFCQVPYDALAPELTDHAGSRNSLYYTTGLMDSLGTVVGLLAPALVGGTARATAKAGCDYHATCMDGVGCVRVVRDWRLQSGDPANRYNVTYTVTAPATTAPASAGPANDTDASNETAVPGPAAPDTYFVMKWPAHYYNETVCRSAPSPATLAAAKAAGDVAPPGPLPGVDGYCQCRLDCLDQAALRSDGYVLSIVGIALAVWYLLFMRLASGGRLKEKKQHTAGGGFAHASTQHKLDSATGQPAAAAADGLRENRQPPLVPSIMNTFKNRAFRVLAPAWAADICVTSVVVSMLTFYVRFALRPERQSPLCGSWSGSAWLPDNNALATEDACSPQYWIEMSVAGLAIGMLTGTCVFSSLLNWRGKVSAWIVLSGFSALTSLAFGAVNAGGNPWACVAVFFLNGMPIGGRWVTDAVLADVIDYDEFLHGRRSEATFTLFKSFLPKMALVPATALPIAFMGYLGFIPLSPGSAVDAEQPANVYLFVKGFMLSVPLVCSLVAYYIKMGPPWWCCLCRCCCTDGGFPLSVSPDIDGQLEDMEAIREGIHAHANGREAFDPVNTRVMRRVNLLLAKSGRAVLDDDSEEVERMRARDAAAASLSGGGDPEAGKQSAAKSAAESASKKRKMASAAAGSVVHMLALPDFAGEAEFAMVDLLDHFPGVTPLRLMLTPVIDGGGPHLIRHKMSRHLFQGVTALVVTASLAWFCFPWLTDTAENNGYRWVPVTCVVIMGLAVCYTALSKARMDAANFLCENTPSVELVERVFVHRLLMRGLDPFDEQYTMRISVSEEKRKLQARLYAGYRMKLGFRELAQTRKDVVRARENEQGSLMMGMQRHKDALVEKDRKKRMAFGEGCSSSDSDGEAEENMMYALHHGRRDGAEYDGTGSAGGARGGGTLTAKVIQLAERKAVAEAKAIAKKEQLQTHVAVGRVVMPEMTHGNKKKVFSREKHPLLAIAMVQPGFPEHKILSDATHLGDPRGRFTWAHLEHSNVLALHFRRLVGMSSQGHKSTVVLFRQPTTGPCQACLFDKSELSVVEVSQFLAKGLKSSGGLDFVKIAGDMGTFLSFMPGQENRAASDAQKGLGHLAKPGTQAWQGLGRGDVQGEAAKPRTYYIKEARR